MQNLIYIAVAGALGSLSRYGLGIWVQNLNLGKFPYGTLSVNIIGCLLIGLIGTFADEKSLLSPQLRAALLFGFLGAFTTFSSFSYDTWNLIKISSYGQAILYVALSLICCFIGLAIGIFTARQLG
ncbi:hypothetical protein BVY03_01790 [bacterium K02(2017)]|nr:hypothetical protein BVY03_01790 [bacterium K02(2017)]